MKKTLLLNYFKAATSRNPRKNTTRFNGLLALFVMVMGIGVNDVMGQIYFHNFGTTSITSKPYTGSPSTFATNLSSSSWTTSAAAWSALAGNGGSPSMSLSLSNSSGTPTYTLTFDVAAGFQVEITHFDFWRVRSTTGAQNWAMTINGVSVGSGTVPTTGAALGSTAVSAARSGLTGTITVVLTMSGASSTGSFRLDDFTLTGSVTSTATPSIAFSAPSIPTSNVNNNSTNNIIGAVQLDVTTADATLNGVTFTTAGTYTASDIATNGFKFWLSTSATDISGATQLGAAQAAATTGSNITVSGLSNTITSATTRYVVLSADIAVSPTNGATLGIASTAHSNITFASGSKTGTDPVAASTTRAIAVAVPSIAISSNHPAAANINQNATNQVFGSIALAVTTANTTLNSITITTGGTYQTSDLVAASFKMYYTTTNTFATTTQLGSGQAIVATGNTITFSGLSQTINSGVTGYLWFTADVAYNAVNGRTLSTTSTVFSNITFASGTKTGTNPVAAGNDQTITTVTPSIVIAQNGPTASNVNFSTTNAILYGLSFAVTGNTTDFNSLTVTTGGTYQTSDLVASSFKLYYTTTNSFSSATQLSTSQAIVTSGNTITFNGINQNILNGTTGYLWLTVDISATAISNRTISITSTAFSNITFAAGNKTGTDPAIAGGVRTITAPPSMTEVVFPQFIQGVNGTNTNRIPFAYRATLNNLTPNATYRYINGVELTSAASTSVGAGNCVFPDPSISNAFVYTTSPSLSTAGNYGTFTTDTNGSYSGWFITAPTSNATRFVPGTSLYARISINDGANGTLSSTVLSSSNTITVINLVNSAGSTNGTGLWGSSSATNKNFVFAYDNTNGTGRPLSGTFVENDGVAETASFASFYVSNVDGVNNAYGMIIPNTNSNGVKRIEFKNFSDNSLQYAVTDADGNWGGSVNTVNPTGGGTTALVLPQIFDDLIVNSNVTLSTATSVFGNVTVQNSATLTTAGLLTLKSNASGTASVGSLASGTITGNVTVERYIPAKRAWRALTAPLKGSANNSIFYNWQNNGSVSSGIGVELWGPGGTGTSGNNTSTSGLANGPGASIKQYGNGWSNVTDSKTTSLFTTNGNNAYMVFVTGGYGSGNISSGFADTTLKSIGQLITGPVSYTGLSSTYHTFIGNPYACPIHPSSIVNGATNLFTNVWVWDPALSTNGGYVNYDGSLGAGTYSSSGGSYTNSTIAIQSGQAFFVRAASGTGSLTLTESMKSSSISNTFRNSNSNMASIFRVGFLKQTASVWMPLDGCIAGFYEGANAAADDADGKKMINTGENIGFVRNAINLSSEHYPLVTAQDILYLKVWNTQQAHYKLKLNTEEFTMAGVEAYLQDLYTGTTQPLNLDGSAQDYEFDVDPTVSASSGNRFRIVFTNTALAVTNPEQGQLSIYPNPATGGKVTVSLPTGNFEGCSYELINVLGQVVRQDQIENGTTSQVSIPITGLPNSWYALRITKDNSVLFQGKLIIKN